MLHFLLEHLEILYLDYTYTTNKYHLPLLNICGAIAQNSTISIGVAPLSSKKKEYFLEALTYINQIF